MGLKPVGVRFASETLDLLERDSKDPAVIERFKLDPARAAPGSVARAIVERHYARPQFDVASITVTAEREVEVRLELMGATEVAEALKTTTSNLDKFVGLPAPKYSKDHEDPRYRLKAGRFWDAAEIRELVAARADGR